MCARRTTPYRWRAPVAALILMLASVTACGGEGDDPGSTASSGLDSVTVAGDLGEAPSVEFNGAVQTESVTTNVLTEGGGDQVGDGDAVLAYIWVGNGSTEKEAYSSHTEGKPELLTVTSNLSGPLYEALNSRTIGSRVVVSAPAAEAFGEQGNPQLGIAADEVVLFVIDLVSAVLTEPSGEEQEAPDWAPKLQQARKQVTGFDFAGTPQPDGKLKQSALVIGNGPPVEKGQTIYVNYLGQVFGGEKPFDSSFGQEQPTSFAIGVGQVVKGWDQSLVGQPVGSRVLIAIPPALGYGKEGNPGAGIKPDDTLYFVVDILAAA